MSITLEKPIKFLETECDLDLVRYNNSRFALQLYTKDGLPFATASVNVPQVALADNEVIIKDYGENEGICQALVEAGVIELTGRAVKTGFVQMPIGLLNPSITAQARVH